MEAVYNVNDNNDDVIIYLKQHQEGNYFNFH